MFAGDEVQLDVGFAVARERLTRLGESGALFAPSADAYSLARVGPGGGVAKLVRVQVHELSWTDKSGGLALRWEATGPGGKLFPALDADLTLTNFGAQGTLVALAGVYRPPLGMLGQTLDLAVLHRVAVATIKDFLARIAAELALADGEAERPARSVPGFIQPGGRRGTARPAR